jgi:hypothetical protein
MSQPAETSRLDSFARVAGWYFKNPPATWSIARRSSGWHVIASDGTYISSHRSRREAAANLTEGRCARDHYATLDWYLDYSRDRRLAPLTDAERDAVAQILSSIAVETSRSEGLNSDELVAQTHQSTANSGNRDDGDRRTDH